MRKNDDFHTTPLKSCETGKVEPLGTDHTDKGGSLCELLVHMRRVREAVPVNERLKEELRTRLCSLQSESGLNQGPTKQLDGDGGLSAPVRTPSFIKRFAYWWLFPVVLLAAAASWFCWNLMAPKFLEAGPAREISLFWLEENPLSFACGPQMNGFLVVRDGALQLLNKHGNRTGIVKPPPGQSYDFPALSCNGNKLALVRRSAGEEQIITVIMPGGTLEEGSVQHLEAALVGAEVIYQVGPGENLSDLTWSPDGQTLAFTRGKPGEKSEVYLLSGSEEPVYLGLGQHSAWSPDGSRLVVERPGESGEAELWLTGSSGSDAVLLTQGERPAWGAQGYLALIRVITTERILSYNPDGTPLFTVQQRQGEIRTLNLGKNGDIIFQRKDAEPLLQGDRLLPVPEARPGEEELQWLRRLEFEGVREPRTLLLNPLSSYEKILFSPDGKALLAARREGGAVVLLQAGLQERITWRGDRKW